MHREPVVDEKDIMRFLTTDLHTTPSATKPNPRLDDGRGFVHERGDAQTACPKQATGKASQGWGDPKLPPVGIFAETPDLERPSVHLDSSQVC